MKTSNLREFEELVLLSIAALKDTAYSVTICEQLEKRADRKIRLGVVHAVLNRLEDKEFIKSSLGEPTKERGGRRKRYFELTDTGKMALLKVKEIRDGFWNIIPETIFKEFV